MDKKPQASISTEFTITKDVIARDAGILDYEKQRIAGDFGLLAAQHFGIPKVEEDLDEQTETYRMTLVVMTVEEFERISELAWMYQDLNDETEDNAQPEGA